MTSTDPFAEASKLKVKSIHEMRWYGYGLQAPSTYLKTILCVCRLHSLWLVPNDIEINSIVGQAEHVFKPICVNAVMRCNQLESVHFIPAFRWTVSPLTRRTTEFDYKMHENHKCMEMYTIEWNDGAQMKWPRPLINTDPDDWPEWTERREPKRWKWGNEFVIINTQTAAGRVTLHIPATKRSKWENKKSVFCCLIWIHVLCLR